MEPEKADTIRVLPTKVENDTEPVMVDAVNVDNVAVPPARVENITEFVIKVEIVVIDPMNVLPITVDINRFVA